MTKKCIVSMILILFLACAGVILSTAHSKESSSGKQYEITFIELGSEGCLPCRMMQPVMERVGKDFAGNVRVVYYDVRTKEGKPYAEKYRVRAIPTQVFLDKNGKEFYRHLGYFPYEEIVELLKKHSVKPVK
ncbi:MAG: thioredoxin [Nitrospiraceae bacterium]|nr:MAG: thioredoxin [Nitrospiraceae bacterium]